VIQEIDWLIKSFHPSSIDFYDETFGSSRTRNLQLLDRMIQNEFNKKTGFCAQTRVGRLDREIFFMMKKAGFVKIEFGVESGNDDMLSQIKKGITLEKTRESVHMAKQAGLETGANFILGHPGETSRTAWDTLHFAAELNTTYLSLGIMVPYPGTELYEMAKRGEKGLISPSEQWEDYDRYFGNVEVLANLSKKVLERYQFYGYMLFYLKNRRISGLMGFIGRNLRSAFIFGLRMLGIKGDSS